MTFPNLSRLVLLSALFLAPIASAVTCTVTATPSPLVLPDYTVLTASTGNVSVTLVFKRLVVYGPWQIFTSLNALPVFAAIALAWAVVFRHYKYAMPGIWFVSLVLMINFGSSSFETYRPLVLGERYMFPLMLPSVLLCAGLLADLFVSGPDSAP